MAKLKTLARSAATVWALWLGALPVAWAQNSQVDRLVDKALRDANQRSQQQANPAAQGSGAPSPAVTASSGSLSSQIEAVRAKIRPCWLFTADTSKDNVAVRIVVQMNRDGRPASAEVADKARYQNDPSYRILADNALRTVNNPRCQPWPLSADKYDSWRKITLVFDPSDK